MATNTRKLSDFLAEGTGDTFGDLPVENPHIKPGTLYPAWSGLLTENTGYTFTDSSASAHAVVETVGDIHQSGSTKKVGNTSLSFPGTAQNSIRYADSADWDFGTGTFTIECWINPSSVVGAARTVCARTVNDTTVLWMLRITSSAKLEFTLNNASGSDHETPSYTVPVNTWTHIAIVRGGDDNKVRLYANGTEVYESAAVDSGSYSGSGEWWFGANPTGSQDYIGYIDEFRYVLGKAVYTGNFAAPTALTTTGGTYSSATNIVNPTSSETKLLLHSEGGGHVGDYGTAQADGRSYYYTDIKGSKPIKDPRIGAYFGSQRHKIKSMQRLEETEALHGDPVYSIDGREWMRGVGMWQHANTSRGNHLRMGYPEDAKAIGSYMEVTGYFNAVNLLNYNEASRAGLNYHIDGGSATATNDSQFTTAFNSPKDGRYVDAQSVHSINVGTIVTPGIHTLKMVITHTTTTGSSQFSGIELIAQDTTSTATKSQIQIPAQNVVTYGKKFALSATAQHYNPFAFKTDGTTAWASGAHNGTSWPVGTGSSHNIDTATSLGLSNWLHSSNYYKPYNGGRVVIWVASDGTIKTSVTVMPPNARSVGNSASLTNGTAKANASVANNTFYSTFEAGIIDNSLTEVAKTFCWREFGNGNANSLSSNYADATIVDHQNWGIAYIMDDGLTSLVSDECHAYEHLQGSDIMNYQTNLHQTALQHGSSGKSIYLTFIGTGIGSAVGGNNPGATDEYDKWIDGVQIRDGAYTRPLDSWGHEIYAQNLPYGSHILRMHANAVDAWNEQYDDFTFYQPKKPPIPENAIVLADYMLMADFVKQTDAEPTEISKGVRYNNASRDHLCTGSGTPATNTTLNPANCQFGLSGGSSNGSSTQSWKLPFFGTTGLSLVESAHQAHSVTLGGSAATETGLQSSFHDRSDAISIAETVTLGPTNIETTLIAGGYYFFGHHVATPIHTSSHYQTFETEFLHELVGGDRNMEQNNLVVTADGKTWDEVTRNTSYIGNGCVSTAEHTDNYTSGNTLKYDRWRGNFYKKDYFNKDFAIGYDKIICLKAGQYKVILHGHSYAAGSSGVTQLYVNTTLVSHMEVDPESGGRGLFSGSWVLTLKRGDYLRVDITNWRGHENFNHFAVERL